MSHYEVSVLESKLLHVKYSLSPQLLHLTFDQSFFSGHSFVKCPTTQLVSTCGDKLEDVFPFADLSRSYGTSRLPGSLACRILCLYALLLYIVVSSASCI